jgi:virulence factor Mce-like protein
VRRLAAIVVLGAAGLAVAILAVLSSTSGGQARVDALFDNVNGLVVGQNVKVAGVPVGTVSSLEVTEDRLALVEMEIDPRYAPFRRDARCEVRPESLIGERAVQCDPGTPEAGELVASDGGTPTVPVERTSSPVSLAVSFNAFELPYRQRLQIILNELGAGLAGRGEDLNALIRRANPAIGYAQDLLATLSRQRAFLRSAIADTDRILVSLARRPQRVGQFIERAAAVTERFARRDSELELATARLPGVLRVAQPALEELDALELRAAPVVRSLRRAAPPSTRLFRALGPLADAARPTLRRVGRAADVGTDALAAARPVVPALGRVLRRLRPVLPTGRELVTSLVERGFTEGLLRFFYNAALAVARYDGVSHIFPAHFILNRCGAYKAGGPPIDACAARFTGTVAPTDASPRATARLAPAEPGQPGTGPGGSPGEGGGGIPEGLSEGGLFDDGSLGASPPDTSAQGDAPADPGLGGLVNGLLDFLLGP